MPAKYPWGDSAKQGSQLYHNHQADFQLRFNSLNRRGCLENSYGRSRWAKIEKETSTREIKTSKAKHFKQNATVVMGEVKYSNKLTYLIDNGGYCKVKKDPTLKTERMLSQILCKNKDFIPQTKCRQLT